MHWLFIFFGCCPLIYLFCSMATSNCWPFRGWTCSLKATKRTNYSYNYIWTILSRLTLDITTNIMIFRPFYIIVYMERIAAKLYENMPQHNSWIRVVLLLIPMLVHLHVLNVERKSIHSYRVHGLLFIVLFTKFLILFELQTFIKIWELSNRLMPIYNIKVFDLQCQILFHILINLILEQKVWHWRYYSSAKQYWLPPSYRLVRGLLLLLYMWVNIKCSILILEQDCRERR